MTGTCGIRTGLAVAGLLGVLWAGVATANARSLAEPTGPRAAPAGQTAPGPYTAVPIGTLGGPASIPYAINEQGVVVGLSSLPDGSGHGFLWDGTIHDLGTLPGNKSSSANAINASGVVVGTSSGTSLAPTAPRHAVMWSGGQIRDLGTLGGVIGFAKGINDYGVVVGASTLANGATHAFVWDGTMHDLGTLPGDTSSQAFGINNAGRIVGESSSPGKPAHAVYWVNGIIHDLGPAGSVSGARAVNGSGTTVGFVSTDGSTFLGARWDRQSTLETYPSLPGRPVTFLEAVTDDGEAAGFALTAGFTDPVGVITQGGTLYDVNTLVPSAGRARALGMWQKFEEITGRGTNCREDYKTAPGRPVGVVAIGKCFDELIAVANVDGNPVAYLLRAVVEALPCVCTKLSVKTKGYGEIPAGSGKPARVFFTTAWKMSCSRGAGVCTGRIRVRVAPLNAGSQVELTPTIDGRATQIVDAGPGGGIQLTCSKSCNKNKASAPAGSFRVGLLGDQFSRRQRAGQTFRITLDAVLRGLRRRRGEAGSIR